MRGFVLTLLVLLPISCAAQQGGAWVWPQTMEELDALPDDTDALGIIHFEQDYWGARDLSRFTRLRRLQIPADQLERAAACVTVEELFISDNFPDHRFKLLKNWTQLRAITTGGVAGWPSFGGLGLRHLPNPERLTDLNIWGCTDAGAGEIAKCINLKSLSVGAQYLTDSGVQKISGLSSLRSFEISGFSALTDESLRSLAKVQSLEVVQVPNAKAVTGAGLEAIAAVKSLRVLNLKGCTVTGTGLGALQKHPALEDLNLSWTSIRTAGLEALATCPNLRLLDLEGCKALTSDGLAKIVGAKLRGLNLRWCSLAGAGALESLNAFPTLEELNLERCRWVTDTAISGLKLPKLRKLNCYGTNCVSGGDPSGLPVIEEVVFGLDLFKGTDLGRWKPAMLMSLRLSAVESLVPEALEAVGRMLTLEVLEISRAPALTADAWRAIAALPALRVLDLSMSAVPPGVLPELSCLDVVEDLDLGWINEVPESELELLMKCPRLSRVTTWGTKLSDDQLSRLVMARPEIVARVDRAHPWKLLDELSRAFPTARLHTLD